MNKKSHPLQSEWPFPLVGAVRFSATMIYIITLIPHSAGELTTPCSQSMCKNFLKKTARHAGGPETLKPSLFEAVA